MHRYDKIHVHMRFRRANERKYPKRPESIRLCPRLVALIVALIYSQSTIPSPIPGHDLLVRMHCLLGRLQP